MLRRLAYPLFLFVAASCGGPEEEVSVETDELFGSFSTINCNAQRTDKLAAAHLAGKRISLMPEYGACVESRMTHKYKKCLDPADPFSSSAVSVQRTNALTIMRSSNTASLNVTCAQLGGAGGSAHYDAYGTSAEDINVDIDFLDNSGPDLDVLERAGIAGVLWHEAMHQQTYAHELDGDTTPCGYADIDYDRHENSVPHMADGCMNPVGVHGRVMGFDCLDTVAGCFVRNQQAFAIGVHRALQGDFVAVGNDTIDRLLLAPGLSVKFCQTDGQTGPVACDVVNNDTLEFRNFQVPALNTISYLEVVPRVIVFRDQYYGGVSQGLGYGEHLALSGGLATVGNDTISSVYVPAGARARVCKHEPGAGGHGLDCVVYDDPVNVGAGMDNNISFVEVVPVVTVYAENDFFGSQGNASPGIYTPPDSGLPVGDDNIASIVVPPGLTAQLCTTFSGSSGTGTCTTFTRSSSALGTFDNQASFLSVTPVLSPRALTVSRVSVNGAATGRVVSSPLGINSPGSSSAMFHDRSMVRLRAFPASGVELTFTGCDFVSGNFCYVHMLSAKAVTATFTLPQSEPGCYQDCFDDCMDNGGIASQCVAECRASCP